MSERFRVYLSYFLVCSIWGSTWLVIKIGLETMTPFLAAGCRFLVASALLFTLIKVRGVKVPFNRSERMFYVIVALTSFSLPFALVYWGEQFIPSGLTSIVFSIYPFMVALFAYLFLPNEKITVWKISGIVLGFFGILEIFSNDIHISGPNTFVGNGGNSGERDSSGIFRHRHQEARPFDSSIRDHLRADAYGSSAVVGGECGT